MKRKTLIKSLNIFILVLLSALLLMTLGACGPSEPASPPEETVEGSNIVIEDAWSRSTPELMEGSGIVYMVIKNNGFEDDKLVAGKTGVAEAIELHQHIMDDNGVMRMRMVEGGFIEIPAGGEVELAPGGLHVMLINLTQSLEAGTTFPLTLKFEKLGEVTIDVPVTHAEPEESMAMEMSTATPEPDPATATVTVAPPAATEKPAEEAPVAAPAIDATPRAPEDLKDGLFINMTTDNIDRAAMAVSFATKVRMNTGRPVTIFFNTQGVRLVDIDIPQNVHKSGKTIHEMLQMFMDEGGVVLVCPVCMKNVGGMETADILPGVIIGSPEYTFSAMFAENVTTISY